MDEPPNEHTDAAGSPEEGTFSQAEINALMQGESSAGESGDTGQADGAPAAEQAGTLNQADIDALMQADGDASSSAAGPSQGEDSAEPADAGAISQADVDALMQGGSDTASPPADSGTVSQNDIDALFSGANASDAGDAAEGAAPPPSEASPAAAQVDTRVDTLGRPFDEAAAAMEAAIAEERAAVQVEASSGSAPDAEPFHLPDLGDDQVPEIDSKRVTMLNDVNLHVRLQLGKTRMLVEDVLKLSEGSVVELDKLAGDPVDVIINERLIARGEVLVLNDVFCVRISEVMSHDPHRVIT